MYLRVIVAVRGSPIQGIFHDAGRDSGEQIITGRSNAIRNGNYTSSSYDLHLEDSRADVATQWYGGLNTFKSNSTRDTLFSTYVDAIWTIDKGRRWNLRLDIVGVPAYLFKRPLRSLSGRLSRTCRGPYEPAGWSHRFSQTR